MFKKKINKLKTIKFIKKNFFFLNNKKPDTMQPYLCQVGPINYMQTNGMQRQGESSLAKKSAQCDFEKSNGR